MSDEFPYWMDTEWMVEDTETTGDGGEESSSEDTEASTEQESE